MNTTLKSTVKSALAAVAFSVLGAGAAFAADECCCKDKDGKMACCDKKAGHGSGAPAPAPAPEPEHKH